MIKAPRFRRVLIVYSFLVFSSSLRLAAQQTNVTEQVEVTRRYKPVLGEANKIKETPNFARETTRPPKLDYSFKAITLKKDTAVHRVFADIPHPFDTLQVFPFYIRGGGGNFRTILGEIYFNSLPLSTGTYGVNYRHLSVLGKIAHQEFSSDELNVYGTKTFGTNDLTGRVALSRKYTPYYGYDHSLITLGNASVEQNFKKINLGLGFSKHVDTSEGIRYQASLGGYYLADAYSEQENHVDVEGRLGFAGKHLEFHLGTDYHYNTFKNPVIQSNNSILRIAPEIRGKTDLFRLKLGLLLAYELGDRNQLYVFPDINLDVLLDQGFNVFGGIKGDIIQHTFDELTTLNPYLSGIRGAGYTGKLDLQNTKQSLLVFGGIKGSFTKEFSYRAQVDIAQYDRLPFFVNTFNRPDNFILVYDGNKTIVTKLYGDFNYQWSDQFRLNLKLTFNQYKLRTLEKPWYTPDYHLEAIIHYNPSRDWLLTASLFAVGTQYAQPQQTQAIAPVPPVPIVATTQAPIRIDPYADLNIGIEYKVSRQVSVFVNGNNLLNKEYLRFVQYPVVGLGVLGGLTVRF